MFSMQSSTAPNRLFSSEETLLLQCNLGHSAQNTLRKVGRYIIQVGVYSSLHIHECMSMRERQTTLWIQGAMSPKVKPTNESEAQALA